MTTPVDAPGLTKDERKEADIREMFYVLKDALVRSLGNSGAHGGAVLLQKAGFGKLDRLTSPAPREWLVIESSQKNAVFADPAIADKKGYIPRDVAEKLLGRDLGGNAWFTADDSQKMRAHPEWRDTDPSPAPLDGEVAEIERRHADCYNDLGAYTPLVHSDIATLLRILRSRSPS